MSKKYINRKTGIVAYQLSQPATTKYLVVVADSGITSEVNYFNSLKEAKRTFGEIAHDHGYKPSEINASDKYDVSIWKWTEDRYAKVF